MRFQFKSKSSIYMVLNILSFLSLFVSGIIFLGGNFFYYLGRSVYYPYYFLFNRPFDFKTGIVIAIAILAIGLFCYSIVKIFKKGSLSIKEIIIPINILTTPYIVLIAIRGNSIGIFNSKEVALVVLTFVSLLAYVVTSILFIINSANLKHSMKTMKIKNIQHTKMNKPRRIKKPFTALILMQLRDKFDFSWTKTTKGKIQKIVLTILKFALITAIVYFLSYFARILLNLYYYSEIIEVMIVIVGFILIMSVISCTLGLMRNLYFADDNKVLVTLPVTSDMLFFSKLIVFYIFEIKKSFDMLLPVILAFLISAVQNSQVSWIAFAWMWIPFLFIVALPVLIGSLLSIPCMYINKFFKKFPLIETVIILFAVAAGIVLVVYLINLIPENIDLNNQWSYVRNFISDFLIGFKTKLSPLAYLVYSMVGNPVNSIPKHQINWITVLTTISLIALSLALIGISYLTAKPLFFSMMTKSFEFDKNLINREVKNKVRKPFISFVNKDFQINFRSVEISGNYLAVYIIVPILILLLNSLFGAMNTKLSGDIMTYSFNILLILLPLLASNSMIATFYSKEGQAGYIKKTKPVKPIFPLIAKLLFNLAFSLPSIVITMAIFGKFSNIGLGNVIILSFAILFIQYAHIFFSATMDIMNPQNEQYATIGDSIDNPNERKSTFLAFALSFAIALISFGLFNESNLRTNGFTQASIKIALIGLALLAFSFGSFALRIKAYYYDK
ncbi:MAG: hypothetical protein J1F31_01180 [Erysipelotrichales bacterium]|nr:hypothetical protein [Erysipelotrichales bacterium]